MTRPYVKTEERRSTATIYRVSWVDPALGRHLAQYVATRSSAAELAQQVRTSRKAAPLVEVAPAPEPTAWRPASGHF